MCQIRLQSGWLPALDLPLRGLTLWRTALPGRPARAILRGNRSSFTGNRDSATSSHRAKCEFSSSERTGAVRSASSGRARSSVRWPSSTTCPLRSVEAIEPTWTLELHQDVLCGLAHSATLARSLLRALSSRLRHDRGRRRVGLNERGRPAHYPAAASGRVVRAARATACGSRCR